MTTAPARRIAALAVALALPLALLTATPASAATVGVTTWAGPTGIKAAFLVNGDTVRLDADITADANDSLVIPASQSITLDLNGYALTITDPATGTGASAAILVPATSSLTINATNGGTLTATGGFLGAGIGGGIGGTSGTVTINGGTINATGGNYGAGIGGGDTGSGGTTTINGGTTTATGGRWAAGIGGGYEGNNGGTTTINGGTINATGGFFGAGIGGGDTGSGGTTTINGGTVNATGGSFGAGIGGGDSGSGGTTIITGGTITATGGVDGAGIGGGCYCDPRDGFTAGVLRVDGTLNGGAATDGGAPVASPITNPPTPPAGVGYSATTSTVGTGGRIDLQFNYLITFAANGGSSAPADQTINDGDTLTAPATPTREGFTFAGWATDDGAAYDFSSPVTAPLTLTAAWTAALAATGADVTTTLGIATLLLVGGVTLIALRRRSAGRRA
jgi:uncharacterized repeat protein (TIGR02543 family)